MLSQLIGRKEGFGRRRIGYDRPEDGPSLKSRTRRTEREMRGDKETHQRGIEDKNNRNQV